MTARTGRGNSGRASGPAESLERNSGARTAKGGSRLAAEAASTPGVGRKPRGRAGSAAGATASFDASRDTSRKSPQGHHESDQVELASRHPDPEAALAAREEEGGEDDDSEEERARPRPDLVFLPAASRRLH
ncbi:MAG: hypothetical protein ACOY9B_06790, partial [Pseudomonadota bacterium]